MMDAKRINPIRIASRPLAAALLLIAGVALTGCTSSGITGISIPPSSPWSTMITTLHSPQSDVQVAAAGSGVSAQLVLEGQGVACTSDQGGFFVQCANPGCQPPGPAAECVNGAPAGTTNVTSLGDPQYIYGLEVDLDRSTFTSGNLVFASPSAGVLGATSLGLDRGSTLDISATFQEGLLPGPVVSRNDSGDSREQAAQLDDFAGVAFSPPWSDFHPGFVCEPATGCDPNVSTEGVLVFCTTTLFGDTVLVRTNPQLTNFGFLNCGGLTVRFDINPPFSSVGDCVTGLVFRQCHSGPSFGACVRTQVLTCQLLSLRKKH